MIDFGVVEPVFCILFATNFFEKNFKVFGGGGIQRETYLLFSSLFFFFRYLNTFAFINHRPYYKICDFQHQKVPFLF